MDIPPLELPERLDLNRRTKIHGYVLFDRQSSRNVISVVVQCSVHTLEAHLGASCHYHAKPNVVIYNVWVQVKTTESCLLWQLSRISLEVYVI